MSQFCHTRRKIHLHAFLVGSIFWAYILINHIFFVILRKGASIAFKNEGLKHFIQEIRVFGIEILDWYWIKNRITFISESLGWDLFLQDLYPVGLILKESFLLFIHRFIYSIQRVTMIINITSYQMKKWELLINIL